MAEMLKKTGIKDFYRQKTAKEKNNEKDTRYIVKIGNRKTEEFWTSRGVRQRSPISPILFNIYIMDLKEELKKEQTGGIVIGKEKIWSISYADDSPNSNM